MEKLRLDDDSALEEKKKKVHQESTKLSFEKFNNILVHACQCQDENCRLPMSSCQNMKRVVQHVENCKKKTNGECEICKTLISVCCYHAKNCQEANCPVLFCVHIKRKLRQQQLQHALKQAQDLIKGCQIGQPSTSSPATSLKMSDTEVKESKKGGRGHPKRAAEPINEKSSEEPKAKRGRGRPKISMGKSKEVKKSSEDSKAKRGRGRPKLSMGKSKKVKKEEESMEESETSNKDD